MAFMIRSSLRRFTLADLHARLLETKSLANKEIGFSAVKHSEKFQTEYWLNDNIHKEVHPVIVNIASDDESDNEDNIFLNRDCE